MNSLRSKSQVVAVVDDDEPLCEALASVLRAAGFAVAPFHSAEQFLESAEGQRASCLILDVRLPGMSGIELQRHLVSTENKVPVIFVSAHGDGSLQQLLLEAGASAFLNKPVRSDRLLKEIDAALTKAQNG